MDDNEEIYELRRSGSVRDILQRIQQKNTEWLNSDFKKKWRPNGPLNDLNIP